MPPERAEVICIRTQRGRRPPPCAECGLSSSLRCDGPPPARTRRKTCDLPLCRTCSTSSGKNVDFCRACAALVKEGKPMRDILVWSGGQLVRAAFAGPDYREVGTPKPDCSKCGTPVESFTRWFAARPDEAILTVTCHGEKESTNVPWVAPELQPESFTLPPCFAQLGLGL